MEVIGDTLCSDDADMVTEAVKKWIEQGAELVVCTGGMSVDPDDRTPLAIRNAADEVITYGARFYPARCLCSHMQEKVPDHGTPGMRNVCKTDDIRSDTAENCGWGTAESRRFYRARRRRFVFELSVCTFPNCSFGK